MRFNPQESVGITLLLQIRRICNPLKLVTITCRHTRRINRIYDFSEEDFFPAESGLTYCVVLFYRQPTVHSCGTKEHPKKCLNERALAINLT